MELAWEACGAALKKELENARIKMNNQDEKSSSQLGSVT
jgi:hypothetical protein